MRKKRLISPRRKFYLILKPEDSLLGAPDPARWIDPLMKYLGLDYRVSLLRAAAFHGSAHQAAMVFQVITLRQLPKIEIGRQRVAILYQSPAAFAESNRPEWLGQIKTETGFTKVAGIELTLLDMCRYFHQAGGINGAAQVIACLQHYLALEGHPISRANAEERMLMKFNQADPAISVVANPAYHSRYASVTLLPGFLTTRCPTECSRLSAKPLED